MNTLPRKSSYRSDSSEFVAVKQNVGSMHPLTAQQIAAQQKQGTAATEGGGLSSDIAPSGSRKPLNHSLFQIEYPDNWQTFGDQSSAVTIAPRGGVLQNAIAYGVMINVYQPEANANLDTATHQLIASLRQSNPDLRAIGHDEDIQVNGMPGKSVDMIGTSPVRVQGGGAVSERDWLVTFQRSDGNLLYLVFISPDQDFGRLRPTFEEMLKSVHLK